MAIDCLYGGAPIDGADDVIIMLHGIGGNASNFKDVMDAFGPDTKHHLIAVNFPGYGGTAPHDGELDFDILAQVVGGVISALDTTKALPLHVVGHSIGGMVGLEYAIRHPQQLTSLTMMGATAAFGGRDETFKDAFLKARLGPLDAGMSMAEMAQNAAPHLVGPKASEGIIAAAEDSLAAVPLSVWRQILKCLVTFNRREDLANVKCPVLVIAGGHDTNAPAKTLSKLADSLTNSRFACQDDAGHLLPLEVPEEIGKTIQDFIVGL